MKFHFPFQRRSARRAAAVLSCLAITTSCLPAQYAIRAPLHDIRLMDQPKEAMRRIRNRDPEFLTTQAVSFIPLFVLAGANPTPREHGQTFQQVASGPIREAVLIGGVPDGSFLIGVMSAGFSLGLFSYFPLGRIKAYETADETGVEK